MIESVTISMSPELERQLWKYSGADDKCQEAWVPSLTMAVSEANSRSALA